MVNSNSFGSFSKVYVTNLINNTSNPPWLFSSLGPGYWACRQCGVTFYIVDEQPTIQKVVDRLDVTTFGSSIPSFLSSERIELYCSACS